MEFRKNNYVVEWPWNTIMYKKYHEDILSFQQWFVQNDEKFVRTFLIDSFNSNYSTPVNNIMIVFAKTFPLNDKYLSSCWEKVSTTLE